MYRTNRRLHRLEQSSNGHQRLINFGFGFFVFIVACFFLTQYAKAPLSPSNLHLPKAAATESPPTFSAKPSWSSEVIAGAIGAKNNGLIGDKNGSTKRPIASIAKVITALAILKKHPLKDNTDLGPTITFTAQDEKLYHHYVAKNGVVFPVKAGTKIHLKHALEAMTLLSANNIADTTARWAFGSLENYYDYANKMLDSRGLKDTRVGGDASGFSPRTVSTAKELVKLGEMALEQPQLAAIVAQKDFDVPGIGVFPNYNRLVTDQNYIGIKPGNTDEAGGTMLFATKHQFKGKEIILIGVVLGTKSGRTPYNSALELADSTKATLKNR